MFSKAEQSQLKLKSLNSSPAKFAVWESKKPVSVQQRLIRTF